MSPGRRNVVLLSIDALRADHLSCYGYCRQTTPTLDAFASEHTQFTSATSVSSHTREALPGLLSGRYPDRCIDDDYRRATETVASMLAETGYATGGFHSNPYVSRGYGFDDGFDEFFDDLALGQHRLLALAQRAFDRLRNRHYAPAADINDRSLAWLDTVDEPFFLWNHYMDPHGPYAPPSEYAREYHGAPVSTKRAQNLYQRAAVKAPESITPAERQEMLDCYNGEIRYTDAQIGAFLDTMDDRGLLDESLVIITADHGDAFGEHGYYGHPRQLDPELLDVPLLVSSPEMPSTTIECPTSTLDVVPTILDAVVGGTDRFPGASLVEIADDPGQFGDRRVFAQARGDQDETHLRRFRVRSQEGACTVTREIESGDVVSGPTGLDALAAPLLEHSAVRLENADVAADAASTPEPDGDVERRLEALGYKE